MAFKILTTEELNRAAENRDPRALFIKGKNLNCGMNTERNPPLGVDYISTADALGDTNSKGRLAFIMYYGFVSESDIHAALGYGTDAAYQGCKSSQHHRHVLTKGGGSRWIWRRLGRAADKGRVEAKKILDTLRPAEQERIKGLSALFV